MIWWDLGDPMMVDKRNGVRYASFFFLEILNPVKPNGFRQPEHLFTTFTVIFSLIAVEVEGGNNVVMRRSGFAGLGLSGEEEGLGNGGVGPTLFINYFFVFLIYV
ncbi:hypothetical protein Hanom_Chr06g00497231 [Helianthus anomalus]